MSRFVMFRVGLALAIVALFVFLGRLAYVATELDAPRVLWFALAIFAGMIARSFWKALRADLDDRKRLLARKDD